MQTLEETLINEGAKDLKKLADKIDVDKITAPYHKAIKRTYV